MKSYATNDVQSLLLRCQGAPVRVSLFAQTDGECLAKYAGIIKRVGRVLVVECLEPPRVQGEGLTAAIELALGGNLYWCYTELEANPKGYELHLAIPKDLQETNRREPRTEVNLPIHYVLPDGSLHPGCLLNLSVGGAAFEGKVFVPRKAVVGLVFELGSGLHFQDVSGEVLRTTPTQAGMWRYGIQFCSLSAEQAHCLRDWVSNRMKEGWRL